MFEHTYISLPFDALPGFSELIPPPGGQWPLLESSTHKQLCLGLTMLSQNWEASPFTRCTGNRLTAQSAYSTHVIHYDGTTHFTKEHPTLKPGPWLPW